MGYNVQVAVDTEHHLIVTHEVTNSGSDRAQLARIAKQAKTVLQAEALEVVADRIYFSGTADGRFGKQDFIDMPEDDAYRCPAGERLPCRYTNEESGKMLLRVGGLSLTAAPSEETGDAPSSVIRCSTTLLRNAKIIDYTASGYVWQNEPHGCSCAQLQDHAITIPTVRPGSTWIPPTDDCKGNSWRALIIDGINQASAGLCAA